MSTKRQDKTLNNCLEPWPWADMFDYRRPRHVMKIGVLLHEVTGEPNTVIFPGHYT